MTITMKKRKSSMCALAGVTCAAMSALAAEMRPIQYVDLESNEVVEVRHSPLPSILALSMMASGTLDW